MKRFLFFFVFVLFLINPVSAQKSQPPANSQQNNPFQAGESLKYLMHYGIIDGATASLQLTEEKMNGQSVLHAVAVGKTIGIADKIFAVNDVYESYFDIESGYPLKSVRKIAEGKYRNYNVVFFNHPYQYLMSLKSGKRNYPDSLKGNIFDVVSAFYFARKNIFKDVKKGDLVTLKTFFDDDFWLLQVKFKGIETIKTNKGKIECLKFSPVVEPGRVFDTQDDVKIWISNDENRIPIRVQMDIIVGSFKADLIEYSGLKFNLNFKK
jgi:hypothetical protein